MLFSFFKKHLSIISKLIVHQVGMMIFGFAVTMGIDSFNQENTAANSDMYLALVSGFSVLFYLVLLVFATNEEGARDKIRIDSGRLERDPALGAKWGLAANSVNILLGVVMCAFYFIDTSFTNTVYDICLTIAVCIQSPYLGLRYVLMPNNPIFFLIMPALPVAAEWLGYYLGIRGVLILPEKKKRP